MSKKDVDNSVIRIGIDLGTTNSEVAICVNDEVEIVKCNEGIDYTPSVFGFDKSENKIVGHRAFKKFIIGSDEDRENLKKEVKRLMGTGEKVKFPRVHKAMLPEEVSAEILKALKEDVKSKNTGVNTKAAVITVPAYFDSVQCEATVRAAKLAGFEQVTILEEPIAAAMAYGYKRAIDANWLVFDFGGGTFDVALITSNGGMLKVVDHGGDNFLGGKDIDKAIVNDIIKPKLREKYTIKDYTDGQESILSSIAEDAKKDLSHNKTTAIDIDNIGYDDKGEEIYLSFELTRERFEEVIKPIVDKTIKIAKEVIERSSIKSSSVSKIILVGGPTQIPYMREKIAEEMRIDLETSVDPLTIVARGACVYGMSQRIEDDIREQDEGEKKKSESSYKVDLHYDTMTSNDSEVVSGTISDLPDGDNYYIRINSDSGYYNSATIPVKKNGFYDTLMIEPGKANRFWIYLTNEAGENLPIYPDSFTITHGLTVRGVPIPHNIGIIYGKKDIRTGEYVEACDEYFSHGDILPLSKSMSYTTLRALSKNDDNELPIEVYEGDYAEPRSNKIITKVSIDGADLPHDLPKGTDIDLTISISASREVSVEAYIPDLDIEVNARVQMFADKVTKKDISNSVDQEIERVEKSNASDSEKREIKRALKEVERDVDENDDTDNCQKASREIDKLRDRISNISNESKKDGLSRRFEEKRKQAEEYLENLKSEDVSKAAGFENNLKDLAKKGDKAIKDKNYDELEYLVEEMEELSREIMTSCVGFWVAMFYKLRSVPEDDFSDSFEARRLKTKGENAMSENDVDDLRSAVVGLLGLLPVDEQEAISDIRAGITR